MLELTVDELKRHIQAEDYEAITGGDDEITETFIDNGREAVKAVLAGYGVEFDESDAVLRLAIIKASLSELYAYSADWVTAEKYKDEASKILRPLAPSSLPSSALVKGSNSWKGFS